jgi:hypothetical protein
MITWKVLSDELSKSGRHSSAHARGLRPLSRHDAATIACLLVPITLLYVSTATPHVLGDDNGEFCTLYAAGGVAHPSGYPLYTLVLRAFSWLPVATPALGAALVTAGIGVLALALAYAACRAWSAGRAAAAFACVLYATAPLAWDLSTRAEVFALTTAIAAAILLVGSPSGPFRGAQRAALLGLALGLGLSHQHTVVLLAPIVAWAAVDACRESARTSYTAAMLFAGVLVGLLPYATLPIAARSGGWVWGDLTTPSGLVAHFLRRDYGTTQLTIRTTRPPLAANLLALARTLFVDLRGVGFALALASLAVGVVRGLRPGAERRSRAIAALAASFVLAGPLFALLMNVELSPEGLASVRRFHLLPMVLLVVPLALGADAVLRRVRAAYRFAAVATALFAGALFGLARVPEEHGAMLEAYVLDTLRTAPPNAVLLGSGDARVFGALYEQVARGIRRDVVFLSPLLLHYDWYRRRAGAALGFSLATPERGSVDTVALARRILQSGRRLFLTDVFSAAIPRRFPTYPVGTLIEVLPEGAPLPSAHDLERQNVDLFATYHIDGAVLDAARAGSRGAREAYTRPWRALAAAFGASGDGDAALRNERRAATLEPWAVSRR